MPQEPRRARRHGAAESPGASARGRRAWVWAGAVAALVMVGGGVWWLSAAHSRAAVPEIGDRVADEGNDHVAVGTVISYRAHPPASGTHYPVPAPAGVYTQGLAPGFWVHSLEHGYVVLLYRPPVVPDLEARFRTMLRDFPPSKFGNVKLVVAPDADMPHPFAVLSWDRRLWLDTFDREKVLEFYRAHVDRGREDVP